MRKNLLVVPLCLAGTVLIRNPNMTEAFNATTPLETNNPTAQPDSVGLHLLTSYDEMPIPEQPQLNYVQSV
jgi:hypothetical protein